jgi:hypothetical protein
MKKSVQNSQLASMSIPSQYICGFYSAIWVLGIGLFSTLFYGVVKFDKNQSITMHMILSPEYRMALTVFVITHYIILLSCVYQKRHMNTGVFITQCIFLLVILVTWIGLIIFLTDLIHFVFVAIFITSIVITLFLLVFITHQWLPKYTLVGGLAALITCGALMVIYINTDVFYIPEYVAFMAYAAVFTFFFTFHPYYEWAPDVEVAEQAELLVLDPEDYKTAYYEDYNHQNTTTPLILGERYQSTKRHQEAKVSYFYFPPLPPLLYPTGPYNA